MSKRKKSSGSEWLTTILAGIAVITIMTLSERRYQPENLAERVVGYFLYPGDLITSLWSDRDLHPRDFIDGLTGQETNSNAEVARQLDTETLRSLVEQYDLQPGNVWRDELDRRQLDQAPESPQN